MKILKFVWIAFIFQTITCAGQQLPRGVHIGTDVVCGAERIDAYKNLIDGKKIGVIANQTSMIGKTHLVDTLLSLHQNIITVFAPEHGFRGVNDAGETIDDGVDAKTGLPLVSLYGNNKQPSDEQMKKLDVMLFDIQDVGVRFYTYISTLQLAMQACAKNNVMMIVLDRPNPNGFYIDGPVLQDSFQSFVGLQKIPVVYGMTIGEYALMLNGEHKLDSNLVCNLTVIPCLHYDHSTLYNLPVKPSPNLPNMTAVYLYPSLCFFEGTKVSVGRGTSLPFQCIGYPDNKVGNFIFTPNPNEGAKNPPYSGKDCKGLDLSGLNFGIFVLNNHINLEWLVDMYNGCAEPKSFFTDYFSKLAGNDVLQKQIEDHTPDYQIRQSWAADIAAFKTVRKKYLLYPDFN